MPIMQHKPYIVELSFMETQKSHDSINKTITDHGGTTPDQCGTCSNVTFRTEFKSDFKLYIPIPVVCLVVVLGNNLILRSDF